MRPFGCLITIDHLGQFDGKADEGFFVGYYLNSKSFRVFNSRRRIVEENLHIRFSESTPNAVGTKASDNADPKSSHDDGSKPLSDDGKKVDEDPRKDSKCNDQEKEDNVNNTNTINAAGTNEVNVVGEKTIIELPFDPNMHALENYSIFDFSSDDQDNGAEADLNNLDTKIQVSPNPTTRIHKDHPLDQVIRDLQSATQTRNMSKNLKEQRFEEPKKVIHALKDPSWIEAMQEELLQFKLQEVWTLVDLLNGKRAIGCIKKHICWTMGFKEGKLIRPYSSKGTKMRSMGELTFFLGLQLKQKKDGIFISQDKYVAEILKKFRFTKVKTASTPMETQKPLLKDEDGEEVDVHMYRSMIGSLMYLTSSKPDIMFVVCACARYQFNLKFSHLQAVKRIFRYLKDQPKLDLWYPQDSPFDLVAYTDSDYAGASLDRKSTT
ncbi:uncharacterized mitochondrial protein-like protein [Tanacetum coccineum]|uniref:Uncharacterized mitochondrial protein-like protein n=1 Tax=Tanacetum coccineum TaxID=301880 RepID=A0ABQ5AMQ5_9ASTR